MKKELVILFICIIFIMMIVVTVNSVSAFSFSDFIDNIGDFFKGKNNPTGRVIEEGECVGPTLETLNPSIQEMCEEFECSEEGWCDEYMDNCIDETRVREFYCDGEVNNLFCNLKTYDCADEGKVCQDGVCVEPEGCDCEDSDGGVNEFVKGTASNSIDSITDETDGCNVIEAFCECNNVKTQTIFCSFGSENGACNPEPSSSCEDNVCTLYTSYSMSRENRTATYQTHTIEHSTLKAGGYRRIYIDGEEIVFPDGEIVGKSYIVGELEITVTAYSRGGTCSTLDTLKIEISQVESACTETDSGADYNNKGYASTSTLKYYWDKCESGYKNKLTEYYCEAGQVKSEEYTCPVACINGKCVSQDTRECYPGQTRCSGDYIERCYDECPYYYEDTRSNVEECTDELAKTMKWIKYKNDPCEHGCKDGVCIGETCTDSDGGLDYSEYGITRISKTSQKDECLYTQGKQTLKEYYCTKEGEIDYKIYECPGECFQGKCVGVEEEKPIIEANIKNQNLYSEKQAFLISDKDWHDVLPLVPITTWTQQKGDDSECQRGYGTPDNICVYPTLIFHDEEALLPFLTIGDLNGGVYYISKGEWQSFIANDNFISKIRVGGGDPDTPYYLQLQDQNGNILFNTKQFTPSTWYEIHEFMFNINVIKGEIYKLVWITPNTNGIYVFFSDDNPYPDGKYSGNNNYDLEMEIYGDDLIMVFDADSTIHFMQQYSLDKLTVIGETPQELDRLLVAEPELGAGLEAKNINRTYTENYTVYWKSYKDVVYVEDDYELALMASIYASLINAPLIIQKTSSDTANIFAGKNVICVGSVSPAGSSCSEQYDLEQLQKKYIEATNTDKIILANPNDLDIKLRKKLQPEKSPPDNPIMELYSKTSLTAPILASAKHEVIISTTSTGYQEVDAFVENKISDLGINPEYLTIVASPNAIDDSIPDPEMSERGIRNSKDDEYAYIDILKKQLKVGRIYSLTIADESSYIARSLFYQQLFSKIYDENEHTGLAIGHDFRGSRNVPIYIKIKTSNSGYESDCFIDFTPIVPVAIYEDNVAFIGNLDGMENLYLYNLTTEEFTQITFSNNNFDSFLSEESLDKYFQSYVSMYKNKIVWQDLRNGNYDIYMYDSNTGKEYQITNGPDDQINPDIYDNKIVWDNRNGDWSIYIYDLVDKQTTKITEDGGTPSIYGDYVTYVQENQITIFNISTSETILITDNNNQKSSPIIYKNKIVWSEGEFEIGEGWNIYLYDLDTNTKSKITSSPNLEAGPNIYEENIVWHEYDPENDNWDIYLYNLDTKEKKRITEDENAQSGPLIYGNRLVWKDERPGEYKYYYDLEEEKTKQIHITPTCKMPVKPEISYYENKQFITYSDHGGADEWSGVIKSGELPWLDLTYSFGAACLTNSFWNLNGGKDTFGPNLIRRGAIAYHGATGVSWSSVLGCEYFAINKLTHGDKITLGGLNNYLFSECVSEGDEVYKQHFILLGDPTLKLELQEVEW